VLTRYTGCARLRRTISDIEQGACLPDPAAGHGTLARCPHLTVTTGPVEELTDEKIDGDNSKMGTSAGAGDICVVHAGILTAIDFRHTPPDRPQAFPFVSQPNFPEGNPNSSTHHHLPKAA
jgi:hypothetical protein